jgi:acyl carrier protein
MVDKVIEILCEVKDDHSLKGILDGNASLIDDVGLDSLQMMNFVIKLEKVFNIDINFEETDPAEFQSINSVCKVIEKALAN